MPLTLWQLDKANTFLQASVRALELCWPGNTFRLLKQISDNFGSIDGLLSEGVAVFAVSSGA